MIYWSKTIAKFVTKANGVSMTGAGIHDGDCSSFRLTDYKGKVVIACINGEFTVKFSRLREGIVLKPQNPKHSDIHFTEYDEITVWGVVTSVIHPV